MGGKGTVWMEKLLLGPEEMRGKGRAYVRHTLNRGVSIGTHTHENEMETMVIVKGQACTPLTGRSNTWKRGISSRPSQEIPMKYLRQGKNRWC